MQIVRFIANLLFYFFFRGRSGFVLPVCFRSRSSREMSFCRLVIFCFAMGPPVPPVAASEAGPSCGPQDRVPLRFRR